MPTELSLESCSIIYLLPANTRGGFGKEEYQYNMYVTCSILQHPALHTPGLEPATQQQDRLGVQRPSE